MSLTPLQAAEIVRCKADFRYFQRTYLRLVNKDAQTVNMKPNAAQRSVAADLAAFQWLMYLKSRQLGVSAEVAAWYLWKAMFNPNVHVLVAAHHAHSVQEMFRKFYYTYYVNLPDWMKDAFWLRGTKRSVPKNNEIHFFHGGRVVISSANSEKARSGTYNYLHLSEFSRYQNLQDTIAAVLGTATPGAQVVFETTANGPNAAYEMWSGLGEFAQARQIERRFIGWPVDERAVGKRVGLTGDRYRVDLGVNETTGQKEIYEVDFATEPLSALEVQYQKDHGLSIEQMAWFHCILTQKYAGSWNTTNQECPITADVAFILGGKPYFTVKYIEAMHGEDAEGLAVFDEPQKFRTYVMGVDVAKGGPDGNWSAAAVIDATTPSDLFDVATLGGRYPVLDFARLIHALALKYHAFVNVESNDAGSAVIEMLLELHYPYLSRRVQLTRATDKLEERVGFHTGAASRTLALGKMHDALARNAYTPRCDRIKRAINVFVYNDKGKPEAAKGRRDDFVFAPAMAIICLDQIGRHREDTTHTRRPETIQEVLLWERATGREYIPDYEVFGNDNDGGVADQILSGRGPRSVMDIMNRISGVGGR